VRWAPADGAALEASRDIRAGDPPGNEVARLFKLMVYLLLSPMGGHALEARSGFAGRDGLANLETPSPQTRLNQQKGKLDPLPYHDLADKGASLAFLSAKSFRIILRSASV
jgi:hypothetical protein